MGGLIPLDFTNQEPNYEILADAIYRQEGGAKARKAYGVLSTPTNGTAEARQVAINTARNNYQRWTKAGQPGDYIDFLASKYVPESADPVGNARWRKNIPAIYEQLSKTKAAPAPAPAPISATPVQTASIFSEPLEQIQYAGQLPRYIP